MKNKVLWMVAIVLCFTMLLFPAIAEDKNISIPEIGVDILFPSGWYTADISHQIDKPILDFFDVTEDEFIENNFINGCYLVAMKKDKFLLRCSSGEAQGDDFKYRSDEEIKAVCKNNMDYLSEDFDVRASVVAHFNETFFCQILESKDKEMAVLYYRTIVNERYFDFHVIFLSGGYNYDDRMSVERIIKSVVIQGSDESEVSGLYREIKIKNGLIRLNIPSDWKYYNETDGFKNFSPAMRQAGEQLFDQGFIFFSTTYDELNTFFVREYETILPDFTGYKDDELLEIGKEYAKTVLKDTNNEREVSIVKGGGKFIKFAKRKGNNWQLIYSTVHQGKEYFFSFVIGDMDYSNLMESLADMIVKSIKFL